MHMDADNASSSTRAGDTRPPIIIMVIVRILNWKTDRKRENGDRGGGGEGRREIKPELSQGDAGIIETHSKARALVRQKQRQTDRKTDRASECVRETKTKTGTVAGRCKHWSSSATILKSQCKENILVGKHILRQVLKQQCNNYNSQESVPQHISCIMSQHRGLSRNLAWCTTE